MRCAKLDGHSTTPHYDTEDRLDRDALTAKGLPNLGPGSPGGSFSKPDSAWPTLFPCVPGRFAMRRNIAAALLMCFALLAFPGQGQQADGGGAQLEVVITGLVEPVHVAFDGVNDDLVYVSERSGRVLMYDLDAEDFVRDGLGLPKSFIELRGLAGSWFQEIGLLSIAFHPDHANNGYVYVGWVDQLQGNHVDRFTRSSADPQTVDFLSRSPVLFVQEPFFNHNGGLALFGPDGYLYYGLGDGGLADDPLDTGQDPTDLLGSIVRLDVDSVESGYAIPEDNPFADGVGGAAEVWSYGLRNPWRFSFDGPDLWIADVGQNVWEEVNHAPGNAAPINYGWPIREGAHPYQSSSHQAAHPLTDPVTEYSHGEGCSITGGHVYRGTDPGLAGIIGKYTFGDYCSQTIWTYDPVNLRQVLIADSGADISSMDVSPDGTQWVSALGIQSTPTGGWVGRIVG